MGQPRWLRSRPLLALSSGRAAAIHLSALRLRPAEVHRGQLCAVRGQARARDLAAALLVCAGSGPGSSAGRGGDPASGPWPEDVATPAGALSSIGRRRARTCSGSCSRPSTTSFARRRSRSRTPSCCPCTGRRPTAARTARVRRCRASATSPASGCCNWARCWSACRSCRRRCTRPGPRRASGGRIRCRPSKC